MKYGILLQEGHTQETVALFRVFSEDQETLVTVILKEGDLVTAGNGKTQRTITEWATGKIVEWDIEDDSLQVAAIYDTVIAFNSGRTVKITTEVMIADSGSTNILGKKP